MAECITKEGWCPNFYECSGKDDVQRSKKLERYCYYCLGTKGVKKIAHKAQWAGSTPKWCPLGRG